MSYRPYHGTYRIATVGSGGVSEYREPPGSSIFRSPPQGPRFTSLLALLAPHRTAPHRMAWHGMASHPYTYPPPLGRGHTHTHTHHTHARLPLLQLVLLLLLPC
ncbi:hypothetical protein CSOJ01_15374 [Colletotrichum sojae]|uniref:Uncharacterized protein n=1 Tax=Colletotrichum sojae TaxID=2175907 RepID=A0A8H6IMG8_9PEZI|nr:hypothetical protein CSOJ01_15374 [Colletotrichum sojae]